jgi:predicted nucleic acid-binding protein
VYLVDTNIISVAAPTKPRPGPALAGWMERNTDRLYVSAVTVMEIEDGIARAIAATARRHGMVVLTRNLRHFVSIDVRAVDSIGNLQALE